MPAMAQLLLAVAVASTVMKRSVTGWAVAPVLVTVKVKAVVPPVLPSVLLKQSIAYEVAVWLEFRRLLFLSFVMVAPVAPLSLTVKASLSSKVVSAQTWTVMVLLGSLGAKVSVPVWLM